MMLRLFTLLVSVYFVSGITVLSNTLTVDKRSNSSTINTITKVPANSVIQRNDLYLASMFASSIEYAGSAKAFSPNCNGYFNHPFLSLFPFRNTTISIEKLNETVEFIISVKSECDSEDSVMFWNLIALEYRLIILQKINFNFKEFLAQEKYTINWEDFDLKTKQDLKNIANLTNVKFPRCVKDSSNILNYLFQSIQLDTCLSKNLIKVKLIKLFEIYLDDKFNSLSQAQIERTDEIIVYKINSYYRFSSTLTTLSTVTQTNVFKISNSPTN